MTALDQPTPKNLADSSVLITGGTAGVGLATALMFARAGVRGIAINGRNLVRGEEACQAIRSQCPGVNVMFIPGDCNLDSEASRVCQQAWDQLDGVDVLVNATTGTAGPVLLKDIGLGEIQSILLDQMMAPLLTCRILLPMMTENGGGAMINIASDAGKVTTPGETVLGAAMAGIIMFTRAMAMEAKRNHIRVNVLTPSVIDGTLTNQRMMGQPFAGKLFTKAKESARLGVCVPDDLANMIVFLASPAAAKVTGQAISVNGGISAA